MKIAIVALLQNLDPAYSVATVVQSHIRMLKKAGHEPVLLTTTDSSIKPEDIGGVEVRAIIPVWKLRDYNCGEELTPEDKDNLKRVVAVLQKHLPEFDRVMEHDCILQGWFAVHGMALNHFEDVGHVIHSIPKNQYIPELGPWHRLLVLNENQIETAKLAYHTEQVTALSNPLDIREFLGMSDITKRFIKDWNLLSYDYIITLPFSGTRWNAKGVPWLATFCKYMENHGKKVALVLLIAHANKLENLSFDKNHFSNAMYEEHKNGVPREVVRDFMLLSDGFFLPSSSELSPLVHMEAALAKNTVFLNGRLKVDSLAHTFNADMQEWVYDVTMRDFMEKSKHLDEFRRVRKEMNEDAIGQKLCSWILAGV